jgi:osmotically-inducible protein OsmY
MAIPTAQLEDRLARALGIPLTIEEDGRQVVVSGMIDTEEARDNALDMVRAAFPAREVVDGLTVTDALASDAGGLEISSEDVGSLDGASDDYSDPSESIEAGDFTDQVTASSPDEAAGPSTSLYEDVVSEGDRVYTPPVDPVGTNTEVIGGLQASSLDSIEVERSALDGAPGDEALRDAILRELREDAATTDLKLDVVVRQGVARIRGRVPWLEDAENAEEVASRVPGIIEVVDETFVDQLETR